MKGINKVFIIGKLLRKPEIKNVNDKFSYCEIIVITTDEWEDKQSKQIKTNEHFITIKLLNKLQDIAMQYLSAGSKVCIEGKINGRKYLDKDGFERFALDIQAINLLMLDSKEAKNVRLTTFDSNTSLTNNDLDEEIPF